MFGELGAIANERGCARVEWRVLKVSLQGTWIIPDVAQFLFLANHNVQWNQPSIDFYVKCLKAEPQSEWEGMRIEGAEGIDRLIGFRK